MVGARAMPLRHVRPFANIVKAESRGKSKTKFSDLAVPRRILYKRAAQIYRKPGAIWYMVKWGIAAAETASSVCFSAGPRVSEGKCAGLFMQARCMNFDSGGHLAADDSLRREPLRWYVLSILRGAAYRL